MGQIHGQNLGSPVTIVDSIGRLHVDSITGGFPDDFKHQSQNSRQFNIIKGNLNKLRLRPQIQNEHVESSREIIGIVGSNTGSITTVGQIFKASEDDINGISLTLESAATFINFNTITSGAGENKIGTMEYSNTGSLQAEYIPSNTLATRSIFTDDIGVTQDNNWAISLPLTTLADKWTAQTLTTDLTGVTFSIKYASTEKITKAKMSFFIGDGTNTKSFTLANTSSKIWQNFKFPETAMTVTANDLTAVTPTMTAIKNIGFRVDLAKNGKFAYADSLSYQKEPGNIDIELWNLGSTLPANNGTHNYTSGTQYTEIGDRGIDNIITSGLRLELIGGKRKYHINKFVAGTALEHPSNTSLISGNYYSLVLKHVDTDTNIYGPDTSFNRNNYNNGYAWNSTINKINVLPGLNGVGSYSDIMFQIFSTGSVFIIKNQLLTSTAPGDNANVAVFAEDKDMKIQHIVTTQQEGGMGRKELKLDSSLRPFSLNKGGKIEAYYNDDPTDGVDKVLFTTDYLYKEPGVNG